MSLLEWIGGMTVSVLSIGAGWLTATIAGNIYGGIKGAYRLRAIKGRYTTKKAPHWRTIRLGLRAWSGMRYKDGFGSYWQMGGVIVPVDGRDKLSHKRWWGA